LGAVLLQLMLTLRGAAAASLGARDIRAVFVVVGISALVSTLFFRRLRPDAGVELSGHRASARNQLATPSAD